MAEEAGVAVGTVQHYFPSRDALLGAAFLEANSTAVAKARAVAAIGGGPLAPWRRLALIVEEFTALDRWGLWVEFWAAARHRDELRAVLEAAYGAWREPIVEAIEEGVASGEFTPRFTPGEIAGAFVALIDGLGIQRELGLRLAVAAAHPRPRPGRARVGAARRTRLKFRRSDVPSTKGTEHVPYPPCAESWGSSASRTPSPTTSASTSRGCSSR